MATIQVWNDVEYETTTKEVAKLKKEYPLDICTCHDDMPCTSHFYILVAVRKERMRAQANLDAMTIDDLLELVKARDGE